jgi:RNA polymerase sigma-70 factor (ECF subfamily)
MSQPSPSADDTSSSLLARARQYDADAWLQLVKWIGPFVLNWCRRARLQAADCEDVSQQALANIWRRLGTFRKDSPGHSFRGWVYVITKNCIADLHERRRRAQAADRLAAGRPLPEPAVELPAEDDPAAAHSWKQRALQLLIRDVVAAHANDRGFRAFYRTAVDGLSAVAVAQELGLSADVVRQHKSRWIKRLRDQLRKQFGDLLE